MKLTKAQKALMRRFADRNRIGLRSHEIIDAGRLEKLGFLAHCNGCTFRRRPAGRKWLADNPEVPDAK